MKTSRVFISCVLAFLCLTFAVEYHLPKKFVWEPTFASNDDQPFGCLLLDSLISASMPGRYSLTDKTLYQLNQEDSISRRAVLVVANPLDFNSLDVTTLLKMAERGCRILLVSNDFSRQLEDTLRFNCRYVYFSIQALKKYATEVVTKERICWIADSVYPARAYASYPQFNGSTLFPKDSLPIRLLAEKDFSDQQDYKIADADTSKVHRNFHPLTAIARPWGKGEIILASSPLLFTNYGVVDGNKAEYLFRLLSQLHGLPLVRTEAYIGRSPLQSAQTPLRYLLKHPPLRWALYLSMLTILLFMLFTARRRQRPIPVVRPPQNRSMEFVELIGTLYYQQKDPADLVRKKFTYFAETLRREAQVDIEEPSEDERTFDRLAQKSGLARDELESFIREVRLVVYGGQNVDDTRMKCYIDRMDEIADELTH
ncbi:MAG: DUF4350 domain-containing protein [Mediterranea sp.]|jgi:hypothetical protein|nr:DUF4350 domain-containing protein [Mediterranea sp.]